MGREQTFNPLYDTSSVTRERRALWADVKKKRLHTLTLFDDAAFVLDPERAFVDQETQQVRGAFARRLEALTQEEITNPETLLSSLNKAIDERLEALYSPFKETGDTLEFQMSMNVLACVYHHLIRYPEDRNQLDKKLESILAKGWHRDFHGDSDIAAALGDHFSEARERWLALRKSQDSTRGSA